MNPELVKQAGDGRATARDTGEGNLHGLLETQVGLARAIEDEGHHAGDGLKIITLNRAGFVASGSGCGHAGFQGIEFALESLFVAAEREVSLESNGSLTLYFRATLFAIGVPVAEIVHLDIALGGQQNGNSGERFGTFSLVLERGIGPSGGLL